MTKNRSSRVKAKPTETVLVGVLKNRRDLDILLTEHWYRIPAVYEPRRQFSYLAFYEPARFGRQGKQIRYYAQVLNSTTKKRKELLPAETSHPKAQDDYLWIRVGKIQKLPQPIKNIIPRRVFFGFASLSRLLNSKNILQLYGVVPTEQIVARGLKQAGIKAVAQYHTSCGKKRFCLDFAVFCQKGKIAVECDNKKAHSSKQQKQKDKIKNILLRQYGWKIVRLKERDIVSDLNGCIREVEKIVKRLGEVKS